MVKKVFISHSSKDLWVTKQIQIRLKSIGLKTFLDEENIGIGDDFEKVILKELRASDELVVLLTPWALERPYVWLEIGAAWMNEIRIIVILYGMSLEDFSSNPKNPILLKKSDVIQLNDFETYLKQLKRRAGKKK